MNCIIQDCDSPARGKGLCWKHYQRLRRTGDVNTVRLVLVKDRPLICIVPGCQNKHTAHNYCSTHDQRFKKYGDPLGVAPKRIIPKKTCSVPGCGSQHKVTRSYCRMHYARYMKHGDPNIALPRFGMQAHALKAYCKRGHPLSGDNLYFWDGHRFCKECIRLRDRLKTQRKREARRQKHGKVS